jgi:hypothetical protein
MPAMNKLTAVAVANMTKPGRYADGNGLYLQVARGGTKSWLFRYMRGGKARQMGLGPVHVVPLARARAKAMECQRGLLEGIDPLEAPTGEGSTDPRGGSQGHCLSGVRRETHSGARGGLA